MERLGIVAVIGATGAVGRHLVPRLVERGYRVRCVVRDRLRAESLLSLGYEVVEGDLLSASTLVTAVAGCSAVVNLATSIPKPGGRGSWEMNDRIRINGTANLIAALGAVGTPVRLLQQSIAMLHPSAGRMVDEHHPIAGEGVLASALSMEEQVMRSSLDWRIARGGALYGPGTDRDGRWLRSIATGEVKTPQDATRWISLLHVTDFASALAHLLEAGSGQIRIVADDEPIQLGHLFAYAARLQGGRQPVPGGADTRPSFRVSNATLRGSGWQPHYASFRSGLVSLL